VGERGRGGGGFGVPRSTSESDAGSPFGGGVNVGELEVRMLALKAEVGGNPRRRMGS